MSEREHGYEVRVEWSGNRGSGTASYREYGRDHVVAADGKAPILASSDAHFRGDATRWNPEELFVASLSSCHQLWYLHLCALAGIKVLAYADRAYGTMVEDAGTGGRFTGVTLHPQVVVSDDSDVERARSLHREAHAVCFIANSVNFPVRCEPSVVRPV